jgi:hypothetical protein
MGPTYRFRADGTFGTDALLLRHRLFPRLVSHARNSAPAGIDHRRYGRAWRVDDSPAFTVLEKRQTFLEEALFLPVAGRSATLLAKFRLPLDRLLEFTVLHELGHALCGERDERRTQDYATQLRDGEFHGCADAKPAGRDAKKRFND